MWRDGVASPKRFLGVLAIEKLRYPNSSLIYVRLPRYEQPLKGSAPFEFILCFPQPKVKWVGAMAPTTVWSGPDLWGYRVRSGREEGGMKNIERVLICSIDYGRGTESTGSTVR